MENLRGTFQEMLHRPVASAISSLLTDAPKLVDVPTAAPDPEPVEDVFVPQNPFEVAMKSMGGLDVEDDDEEEGYVQLTPEEIKIKAAMKTEMWSALLALAISFANRWAAGQQLRKGDEELVNESDRIFQNTGSYPAYAPDHPYHDARERYEAFEEALDKATADAELDGDQKSLLEKAIAANLRAKNKRGKSKQSGILETILELAIIKSLAPLMSVGVLYMHKGSKRRIR